MPAPSREDLDAAIDHIADRLVRNSAGAGPLGAAALPTATPAAVAAVSGCMTADALSLSALLAFRAASRLSRPGVRIVADQIAAALDEITSDLAKSGGAS